ncbi:MAG: DUF167 domain-containing protein [Acidobacteria bacterium]|nr:DUF167 domain-containing protein [Acidobacteriota bacterium]
MGQGTFVLAVHVHPGSRRPGVGGVHQGRLVVRVRARPVDGAANDEVLDALAAALGLRRSDVSFVHVSRSRDKLVAVEDSATLRARLHSLLGAPDGTAHLARGRDPGGH